MAELRIIVEALISAFLLFVYVLLMLMIVVDLFRDRRLGGVSKALWILALLMFPFLAALIYVVARGRGMTERARERRLGAVSPHIGEISRQASVDEIMRAKTLLDQGVISSDEFVVLKRGALAHAAQ